MNIVTVSDQLQGAPVWQFMAPASPKLSTPVKPLPVAKPSLLNAIAPGPPQVIYSSAMFARQGFVVEKHICSPGERVPAVTDYHVISLLCGRAARLEYPGPDQMRGPSVESPGTIAILPAGPVPGVARRPDSGGHPQLVGLWPGDRPDRSGEIRVGEVPDSGAVPDHERR